jgi:hypothetical protein
MTKNDDDETVEVQVTPAPSSERPWLALSGSLSKEAAEALASALDELFPPWTIGAESGVGACSERRVGL